MLSYFLNGYRLTTLTVITLYLKEQYMYPHTTHTIYETILLLVPSPHHHHKLMHSLERDLPLPWIYAHAKYVWFYCLLHFCVLPPEPSKMSLIPMSLLFLGTPSMVQAVLCNYSAEIDTKYLKEHNI